VDLLEELLNLLLDEVVDLVGELLGLAGEDLSAVDDLARDDLDLVLDGGLDVLEGGRSTGSLVATGSENLRVVAAATTVPGEEVGGVSIGHAGEGTLGGDGDEVLLELLGGDGGEGVLRVLGGLERKVVGEETADVRRGHGSARDGVDGILGADPGRLDAQTRGEDVSALAEVGEVGAAVVKSRSTDGDGLRSGSGRVLAGVGIVVASSDGEVNTRADSSVDRSIESLGLATAERHVGNGALEALALAVLGSLDVVKMASGGKLNTLDNIGHAAGAVGAENLDGVDVRLLGDAILLTGDGSRAVSAVTVAILIGVTLREIYHVSFRKKIQ
jgi:hypothetical protein